MIFSVQGGVFFDRMAPIIDNFPTSPFLKVLLTFENTKTLHDIKNEHIDSNLLSGNFASTHFLKLLVPLQIRESQ